MCGPLGGGNHPGKVPELQENGEWGRCWQAHRENDKARDAVRDAPAKIHDDV